MKLQTVLLTLSLLPAFPALSQTPVYPLDVGDRWQYTINVNSFLYDTYALSDSLMPNGNRYIELTGGVFATHSFQRRVGNQIRWMGPYSSSEVVRYDFGLVPGDTVSSSPGVLDTLDIILTSRTNTSIFGRIRRQWTFAFRFRHIVDGNQIHVVTDSIGLTYLEESNAAFTLRGALVNGMIFGTLTDIKARGIVLPLQFGLAQNYPNPFNPSTTISYALPTASHVILKIFDLLGREVVTLADEKQSAGFKSAEWNATGFSSGAYFCRLQAGNSVSITKLLLER
jgi:hypothetical protein